MDSCFFFVCNFKQQIVDVSRKLFPDSCGFFGLFKYWKWIWSCGFCGRWWCVSWSPYKFQTPFRLLRTLLKKVFLFLELPSDHALTKALLRFRASCFSFCISLWFFCFCFCFQSVNLSLFKWHLSLFSHLLGAYSYSFLFWHSTCWDSLLRS